MHVEGDSASALKYQVYIDVWSGPVAESKSAGGLKNTNAERGVN